MTYANCLSKSIYGQIAVKSGSDRTAIKSTNCEQAHIRENRETSVTRSSTLTIGKIAELAGVSKSTVSLALRNSSKIQKQTCQKIQAIAHEMNYRPNPLVSAQMVHIRQNLRRKSAPTIGFLNLWKGKSDDRTSRAKGVGGYYLGAKERAAELGFTVDLLEFDRCKYTDQRLQEILHQRAIEGLILAPCCVSTQDLKLNWDEYTISAIGCFSSINNIHRFSYDRFGCIQDIMNMLGIRAYQRVGFVTNEKEEAQTGRLLSGGYLEYQSRIIPESSRIPLLRLSAVEENYSKEDYLNISDWLTLNKPDAIISTGVNLPNHLRSLGLRVPEDIGYVTLGWSEDGLGDCAGYYLSEEKVGAAAVDSLVIRLYQNERGLPASPVTALMYGEFIDGNSLRKASQINPQFKTG